MSLDARRDFLRSSAVMFVGSLAGVGFVGRNSAGLSPRLVRTPLVLGHLHPSNNLLNYANAGIAQALVAVHRRTVRKRDVKLAARKLKMIAHHLEDCGFDGVMKSDVDACNQQQVRALEKQQIAVAVRFLRQYDARVTSDDLVPLGLHSSPVVKKVLVAVREHGLSSFFYDSCDYLEDLRRSTIISSAEDKPAGLWAHPGRNNFDSLLSVDNHTIEFRCFRDDENFQEPSTSSFSVLASLASCVASSKGCANIQDSIATSIILAGSLVELVPSRFLWQRMQFPWSQPYIAVRS